MKYNGQSEKNIIKSLELFEKGTAVSDILNLFPEQKEELQALFQTMETVQSAKNSIRPPETLLQKIISQIPDERTEHQENHVPSFGFSAWFKFTIPTAAIAVVAVMFYSKLLPEESQKIVQKSADQTAIPAVVSPASTPIVGSKKNEKTSSPAPASAAASNNLDDLINEAITLADNQQFIQNEDTDTSFINSDDQAFDDFSQFYNEKEL